MKITLTRNAGGHANGDTIDRSDRVAQLLIANGAAVKAEQADETVDHETDEQPKPKRTRRSQARKTDGEGRDDAKAADKPAGQKGGGVPRPSPAPTAG